jgi:hypothetical protein
LAFDKAFIKAIAIFGVAIFSTSAFCQNRVTDSTATIIAYWGKGDLMHYSFTQQKQKSKAGKIIADNSSTSVIDLEVVAATDTGYTLTWKYSNIKLNTPGATEFVVKMSKLTEGMVIRYNTDETGAFKEILNLQEIQSFMTDVTAELSKKFTNAIENKTVEELRKMYSNKDFIEQIVLKDLQLFHNAYGGEYTLHEKLQAETELPNFLGGPPFPATLSIEMTALEPLKNYCTIVMKQDLEKEKATKIMNTWLSKISDGKSPANALPDFSMNDHSESEFDLETGWVKNIKYKRVAKSDDAGNTETYTFKKL